MSGGKGCGKSPRCTLSAGHKKPCDITDLRGAVEYGCSEEHVFYSRHDMTGRPCPQRRGTGAVDYVGITSVCGLPLRRV